MFRHCLDGPHDLLAVIVYRRDEDIAVQFGNERSDVVRPRCLGVKSVLDELLDPVVVPRAVLIAEPEFGVGMEAVPAFRGVKVGMSVAHRRAREADDTSNDRGGGVRRHSEHQFADEVCALVNIVERRKVVDGFEEVVDKVCCL